MRKTDHIPSHHGRNGMVKTLILGILIFAIFLSLTIAAKQTKDVRQQFIQKVASNAKIADEAILKDRARLEEYYQTWKQTKNISWWDLRWLENLAKKYNIQNPNFNQPETWQTLLVRVDIIPISMVIAQAAHESDWGRSRFAMEANNYFGQHCFKRGCGLVPKQRSEGETFEVERFSNLLGSITSYMLILNSHGAYTKLRQIRAKLRGEHKQILGIKVAEGLGFFSQNPKYIYIIQELIMRYQLFQYHLHMELVYS